MSERTPAWIGIGIGLGLGIVYTIALVGTQGPAFGLSFGSAYVLPFAVALVALELDPVPLRTFWLGCAVASLLLAFTSLAGVTLPLALPAIAFLVAAVRSRGWGRPVTALILGFGPVAAAAATVSAMFAEMAAQFYGRLGIGLGIWVATGTVLVMRGRRTVRAAA